MWQTVSHDMPHVSIDVISKFLEKGTKTKIGNYQAVCSITLLQQREYLCVFRMVYDCSNDLKDVKQNYAQKIVHIVINHQLISFSCNTR